MKPHTTSGRISLGVVAATAVAFAACSEPRPSRTGELKWTTYDADASLILTARCVECHSGSNAGGRYRLDDYLSAVARRDDGTPRVSAGDPNSQLLAAAQGQRPGHSQIPQTEVDVLKDWVVRSHLARKQYTIHDKGWMDPGNFAEFHGRVLRGTGYAFENCTSCHGSDLRGSVTGVDCNSCHAQGVLACNTCHGDSASPAPPRDLDGIRVSTSIGVGAHRAHALNGALHVAYDCTRCHQFAPDHYTNAAQPNARPVNVSFLGTGSSVGMWDRTSATCANSYCHNPLAGDTNATHVPFRWTAVGTGGAACGTCHGIPPSTHVDDRCPACHQQHDDGALFSTRLHANGVVDLGNNGSGCSGCHGDSTSPAPPNDVLGRTDERVKTVGAHRAHLEARHLLRGPISCTECHAVPTPTPTDIHFPGHIDHLPPAIVFPTAAGVLARTDGANPTYSSATATCGSVYCHGGGNLAMSDNASTVNRMPSWTGGSSQAACGTCHGIPPLNSAHDGGVGDITQCFHCHADTIDRTGSLIVTRDAVTGEIHSTHIDGMVQLDGGV